MLILLVLLNAMCPIMLNDTQLYTFYLWRQGESNLSNQAGSIHLFYDVDWSLWGSWPSFQLEAEYTHPNKTRAGLLSTPSTREKFPTAFAERDRFSLRSVGEKQLVCGITLMMVHKCLLNLQIIITMGGANVHSANGLEYGNNSQWLDELSGGESTKPLQIIQIILSLRNQEHGWWIGTVPIVQLGWFPLLGSVKFEWSSWTSKYFTDFLQQWKLPVKRRGTWK